MPSTSSTRGVFHGLTLAPFKQSFKQLVPLGQPSRGLNVLANFVSAHGGGFSFVVEAATHLVFPHEVTQQRVRVTNGARGGNEGWLEALIRQYGWLEGPDGEAQPPRSDKVVLVTDKWVRDCVESGELLSTRCLVRGVLPGSTITPRPRPSVDTDNYGISPYPSLTGPLASPRPQSESSSLRGDDAPAAQSLTGKLSSSYVPRTPGVARDMPPERPRAGEGTAIDVPAPPDTGAGRTGYRRDLDPRVQRLGRRNASSAPLAGDTHSPSGSTTKTSIEHARRIPTKRRADEVSPAASSLSSLDQIADLQEVAHAHTLPEPTRSTGHAGALNKVLVAATGLPLMIYASSDVSPTTTSLITILGGELCSAHDATIIVVPLNPGTQPYRHSLSFEMACKVEQHRGRAIVSEAWVAECCNRGCIVPVEDWRIRLVTSSMASSSDSTGPSTPLGLPISPSSPIDGTGTGDGLMVARLADVDEPALSLQLHKRARTALSASSLNTPHITAKRTLSSDATGKAPSSDAVALVDRAEFGRLVQHLQT